MGSQISHIYVPGGLAKASIGSNRGNGLIKLNQGRDRLPVLETVLTIGLLCKIGALSSTKKVEQCEQQHNRLILS